MLMDYLIMKRLIYYEGPFISNSGYVTVHTSRRRVTTMYGSIYYSYFIINIPVRRLLHLTAFKVTRQEIGKKI